MSLLPDTELRKNIIQQVLIGYLSRNLSEGFEGITDIEGEEVALDIAAEAFVDCYERRMGLVQGIDMARIGHDGIGGVERARIE